MPESKVDPYVAKIAFKLFPLGAPKVATQSALTNAVYDFVKSIGV
jgi:hypothetical protein